MGWNGSKIYWRIDLGYLQINMITRQVGDFGFPTPDANEFDLAALSPSLDSLSPTAFPFRCCASPRRFYHFISPSLIIPYPTSPPLLDTFLSPATSLCFCRFFHHFAVVASVIRADFLPLSPLPFCLSIRKGFFSRIIALLQSPTTCP